MKYFPPFFVPACFLVAGCVSSFAISDSELPTATTKELCQALASGRANNDDQLAVRALTELERRKTFSTGELHNIAKETAAVGMTEEAGLCAWGYYWYDVNTTKTAAGTVRQYVIGDGTYNPRRYLYTANGRVTATQE